MWLEEEFPYYEIIFDNNSYEKTDYNEIVQCAFREWKLMIEKRENFEISDDEYLDWKLNFMNETIKLEISGKGKADYLLKEYTLYK